MIGFSEYFTPAVFLEKNKSLVEVLLLMVTTNSLQLIIKYAVNYYTGSPTTLHTKAFVVHVLLFSLSHAELSNTQPLADQ